MNFRTSVISLCLLLFSNASLSQDIGFTQFFVNPSLLNPSFTGAEGRPVMYLSYRKQWAGIDGSPQLMNFNLQTALVNRLNMGFNVSNQKIGLLSNTSFLFTGGYTVPLSLNNFLRFGISVGASFNKVDQNLLNFGPVPGAGQDPLLAGLVSNSTQLLGNLGVSYHSKSFHIGVAVPTLFQRTSLSSTAFNANFKPFDNLVFHASNRFYLQNGKDVIEPYVVYRMTNGLPGQFEVAALFHYQHLGWIGVSYRQDYGLSGLLGFKMNKIFALGYSYSIQNSGTNELGKASHEVHLAYLFGEHKKNIPQTYSFVDTDKEKHHKKSAAEIAQEQKKKEALAKQNEKKPVTKPVEVKKEPQKVTPEPVVPVVVDAQHLEEQEKIKRIELHADNPLEEHNEQGHPHAERHEFVKRGEHHAEMDLGDYVIAGVFRSEAYAKQFNDGLKKMGFSDTDYGYLTNKQLWYVHISESNDINEARAQRDKFRKLRVFRDAWLLTVQ